VAGVKKGSDATLPAPLLPRKHRPLPPSQTSHEQRGSSLVHNTQRTEEGISFPRRFLIYFFANQITYRRRRARISGKSVTYVTYLLKFYSFKCRGPTKAPFAPVLGPLHSSGTAAIPGISRPDHGALTVRKSQPPPSRKPRAESWSHFSWPNVWLGVYEKHNTKLL
jgi:hypothetical protein